MELARDKIKCSLETCEAMYYVTVVDNTEGGARAVIHYLKRKGLCPEHEWRVPDEPEADKRGPSFYRCKRCHRAIHLAQRAEHDAKHAMNRKEAKWAKAQARQR